MMHPICDNFLLGQLHMWALDQIRALSSSYLERKKKKNSKLHKEAHVHPYINKKKKKEGSDN